MNIQDIRAGDYFIPDLELPKESRPMGRWGRMHRDYLREHKPIPYNCLLLSGELWTFLADLNEQAQNRPGWIISQMKAAEGITEALKASGPKTSVSIYRYCLLNICTPPLLRQHRTMGAAGFGGSFVPIVQYEKWEIHPVFPHFPYFRLGQNISPNLLVPLCGVALKKQYTRLGKNCLHY